MMVPNIWHIGVSVSVFPVLGGLIYHILFTFTSLLRPSRVSFWEDSTEVFEEFVPEIHQDLHWWTFWLSDYDWIELPSTGSLHSVYLYTSVTELVTDLLPFEHHLVHQSRPAYLQTSTVTWCCTCDWLPSCWISTQLLNCQIALGKLC